MNSLKIIRLLKLSWLLYACTVFSFTYAQKSKIKKASTEYRDFAYIKTSEILLEVVEKGYKSADILQKLGDSFYFNNKMQEASKWYAELFEQNEIVDKEYYFRYAQALKALQNYSESDIWMTKFADANRNDLRAKSFLSTQDYLTKIENSSLDFQLKNLELNSEDSDFGTFLLNDQLIFSSSRGDGIKYEWNQQPYFNLYFAEKNNEEIYNNVSKLNELNTKYHESSIAITSDGKTLYFTRNDYFKGKYRKSKKGTNHLQLFRASLGENGQWENIKPCTINSNEYSVGHPTINSSGTKLYFSSDKEGTYGKSDIFVSEINSDGSLSEPENLGQFINTEGRESFPFINSKGDLFFSSDGFNGLGGLDVYVVRDFENKKKLSQPYVLVNLAKPINSSMDDFAYFEDHKSKVGFISSNRPGGKGEDDIYSFPVQECEQTVRGMILDIDTKLPLQGVTVVLLDNESKPLRQELSTTNGSYYFKGLDCDKQYLIRASLKKYSSDEKRITTTYVTNKENIIDFELKRDEIEINPCDDLAKILDIPIIYFDFDQSIIRYDAEMELQKVLVVLEKYPSLKIDIRSHTDCRGLESYNEKLSERRAQSTRQYLIDKGIDSSRIRAKGFGEYMLINHCGCEPDNNSDCSEEEHQLNRRSEFIVTEFKGKKCD